MRCTNTTFRMRPFNPRRAAGRPQETADADRRSDSAPRSATPKTGKGRAAARRHSPARPPARRHRARAGGAPTSSTSSSASARPRSASTATTRPAPRRELEATLDSLDNDQTLSIVRAFSYFSHLANIAEDQHHIRRNRAHVRMKSAPRPGALAHAFRRAAEAGIDAAALRAFFDSALVSPVLTAHPTEVRRKSTLNRELEIARADRRAPPPGRRRGRARAQRRGAAARRPHAVAHQHAAPDAAQGDRRSRQRPVLLRLHVLSRAAAHLLRDRGRTRAPGADRRRQARRLVPARRLVDRRRPRRQPLRHRRRAGRGDAPAERARARPLSRGAARARRRAVDERRR